MYPVFTKKIALNLTTEHVEMLEEIKKKTKLTGTTATIRKAIEYYYDQIKLLNK